MKDHVHPFVRSKYGLAVRDDEWEMKGCKITFPTNPQYTHTALCADILYKEYKLPKKGRFHIRRQAKQGKSHCDCIVFVTKESDLFTLAIEVKSWPCEVSHAEKQLRAGSLVAQVLLKRCEDERRNGLGYDEICRLPKSELEIANSKFIPLLVRRPLVGSQARVPEINRPIPWGSHHVKVITTDCGKSLFDIVESIS